jgi:hypothetical protein
MPVTSTSRRVFTLVAVLLALTLVALVVPARSHAAVVTNQRVDLSVPMINPCTGESIVLEGSTHFIFTITVDQGGGEHFVSQSNTQGTAISASGARYVLVTGGMFVETPDNGPVLGFTNTSTFRVIRVGADSTADDYTVTTVFKGLVVHDQVVVDLERFEAECA